MKLPREENNNWHRLFEQKEPNSGNCASKSNFTRKKKNVTDEKSLFHPFPAK